jgi:REP element-mobilizing transposase RayT
MDFQFFDPAAEVEISQRCLPHWGQDGATYFITFRTADALPEPVIRAWREERDNWLRRHKINPLSRNLDELLLMLPLDARREYYNTFNARWHELLDAGHACVLRQPELAKKVATSLLHFDGDRYEMGDFVVMPNHVHLLAMFPTFQAMKLQCRSWKKFTAGEINEVLGQTGQFWQVESFDHLVRSQMQFEYYQQYIAENPTRARLAVGEFFYYGRRAEPSSVGEVC